MIAKIRPEEGLTAVSSLESCIISTEPTISIPYRFESCPRETIHPLKMDVDGCGGRGRHTSLAGGARKSGCCKAVLENQVR